MTIFMLERTSRDNNNRDQWELDPDDVGYFTDRALAQKSVDDLNATLLGRIYEAAKARDAKRNGAIKEHNALVDAGLRQDRREESAPIEPTLEAWLGGHPASHFLETYYSVTEIEMSAAQRAENGD